MSRRKPVPKFIPSPPPSPPSSPSSPFRRLSLSLGSAVEKDMPPLPLDWRDVIDRAVGSDRKTSSALPSIKTTIDYPSEDVLENDLELMCRSSPGVMDLDAPGNACVISAPPSPSETCCDSDGPVSRPGSPMPWTHSRRTTGKIKAQPEYRPPTPPLPGVRSRSRSADSGNTSPVATIASQLQVPPEPPFLAASHESAKSSKSSYTHVEPQSSSSHHSHSHSHSQQSTFSFKTPPTISSTHEISNPISLPSQPEHGDCTSREYAPTLASTCTVVHTRPPSALNFETSLEKSRDKSLPPTHVVDIKSEEPGPPPAVYPMRSIPSHTSLTFRQTMNRWRRSFSRKMKRFGVALRLAVCAPTL
ncbi:hypothetical protein BJ138DRAFT_1110766 [Hygrophoropsis aurantiaca]|uniref:Uncharacterized protein n=1 Tax=Hygrophoropsis aurantiaca TaxID=72124 RepID=A0ACB8ALD5_9AGAM|nr:hypothetical protein BJ138DRAFT_1110766 [Hygrophoropsis aurantiaca]